MRQITFRERELKKSARRDLESKILNPHDVAQKHILKTEYSEYKKQQIERHGYRVVFYYLGKEYLMTYNKV